MSAFLIASIVLGVQIVFWILWWVAFSGDRKKQGVHTQLPPVSIIVCAHDEEKNLRELVPLLLQQDHPQFEVIVVEDRSNDGTFDFLLEATKADPRLRMVRVAQTPSHINGKKYAITLGVKAATYEWILFTDADCRPASTHWASTMSSYMDESHQFVIGFSPYIKTSGLLNSFIRFETFTTVIQYAGLALLGMPYMGVGRNLAYRKSLFLDSKGFNNYLGVMGGDDDLFVNQHATRRNVAVATGKDSITYSYPKATFKEFYYQKLRHLSVGKHYRFSHRLVLGLFALSWILTWVAALPLVLISTYAIWGAALFVVRFICIEMAFRMAARKLGEPFEGWKLPFLDFIYAFYYLVAGPVAFLSKKVRWKI